MAGPAISGGTAHHQLRLRPERHAGQRTIGLLPWTEDKSMSASPARTAVVHPSSLTRTYDPAAAFVDSMQSTSVPWRGSCSPWHQRVPRTPAICAERKEFQWLEQSWFVSSSSPWSVLFTRFLMQPTEINLVGTYACEGTNPDGATYSGIVEIVQAQRHLSGQVDDAERQLRSLAWESSAETSSPVSYYGGTPALVVYAVAEDGRLNGKWTAGGADGEVFTETLTKMPAGTRKPVKREKSTGPRISI